MSNSIDSSTASDGVVGFDAAVGNFTQSVFEMSAALAQHTELDLTRARVTTLGMDLSSFCGNFRVAYLRAFDQLQRRLEDFAEEVARRPGEGATAEEWAAHAEAISRRPSVDIEYKEFLEEVEGRGPTVQLFASFKGLGYAVRAYQDGLYGVMLARSSKPGRYSSMADCLKKADNPIARAIDEDLPAYRGWFTQWKAMRDALKLGRPVSLSGDGSGLRVRVGSFAQDGTAEYRADALDIGLPEIVTAIRLSEQLGAVATSFIANRA